MARRSPTRAGHAMLATALLAATAVGLVVTAAATYSSSRGSRLQLTEELTAQELAGALVRTGLTPEHLAAAGLSAQRTAALVAAARNHLSGTIGDLRNADAAYAAAKAEHDRLLDLVRSGRAGEQDLTGLVSARATLASARAALDAELADLVAAATHGLTEAEVAVLTALRANADRPVPVKFRVMDRTDAQWTELRDALAHTRICERRGEQPSSAATQCVLSAESAAAVATAAANLEANLDAVVAAWNTAVEF